MWYWRLFPPKSLESVLATITGKPGMRHVMIVSAVGLPVLQCGSMERQEQLTVAGQAIRYLRVLRTASEHSEKAFDQFSVSLPSTQLHCLVYREYLIVYCWNTEVDHSWKLSQQTARFLLPLIKL